MHSIEPSSQTRFLLISLPHLSSGAWATRRWRTCREGSSEEPRGKEIQVKRQYLSFCYGEESSQALYSQDSIMDILSCTTFERFFKIIPYILLMVSQRSCDRLSLSAVCVPKKSGSSCPECLFSRHRIRNLAVHTHTLPHYFLYVLPSRKR